ncbi:MAG: hypothetical protein R3272_14900 [Candidatus Promineifilaceae bacterium]|nr:hypothetical protein [Candidatus Promineifilaceae bacterium]
MGRIVLLLMLLAALPLISCSPASEAAADGAAVRKTEAPVVSHPSQGDVVTIEDASALLLTDDEGAAVSMRTALLNPGHVYTLWLVVINDPENCEARPCTPADILNNADAVRADVGYADGLVAGEDGRGNFAAYQPVGDLPDNWFGHGLADPREAEMHLIVHDHGPLRAEMAEDMLTTYRGGCTDDSLSPAMPAFTKEFGRAGDNICALVQQAQFEQ